MRRLLYATRLAAVTAVAASTACGDVPADGWAGTVCLFLAAGSLLNASEASGRATSGTTLDPDSIILQGRLYVADADRMNAIRSLDALASCSGPSGDFTTRVSSHQSGDMVFVQHYGYRPDTVFAGIRGGRGWQRDGSSRIAPIGEDATAFFRAHDFLMTIVDPGGRLGEPTAARPGTFQGVAVITVDFRSLGGAAAHYAADDGRPMGIAYPDPSSQAEPSTQAEFDDWREYGEVRLPQVVRLIQDEAVWEYRFTSIGINTLQPEELDPLRVVTAPMRIGGIQFQPVHDAEVEVGGTSRGVAWGDFTGDGYPDLVVSNTDEERLFLYRNVPGQRLERITDSEVTVASGYAQGVSWVDVDNDGDLDLFVARERGPNLLFRNDDGVLRGADAGALTSDSLDSIQGCWADYDGDALLDVYVVHAAYQDDVLYRNIGDGRFTSIAGPWSGLENHGRSCAWSDVDGDGHPDLYVANAYHEVAGSIRTAPNSFFRNVDGSTFVRVMQGEHVNFHGYSYGASFADHDDDGDDDLLVTNIGRYDPNVLFENLDGSLFQPAPGSMVMRDISRPAEGHAWGDYDNDGDLDLFLAEGHGGALPEHAPFDNRDRLYENRGGGDFEVAALPSLTDHDLVSAGSAAADFDRDGDLDLFIANWGESETEGRKQDNQFFLNISEARGWIQLRLEGTRSNRMGLGARAVVVTGEGSVARKQHRTLTSTSGFGSMAEPILHFGLDGATEVGHLEIHWPSGAVDVHEGVSANRRYLAVEGGELRPDPARRRQFDAGRRDTTDDDPNPDEDRL